MAINLCLVLRRSSKLLGLNAKFYCYKQDVQKQTTRISKMEATHTTNLDVGIVAPTIGDHAAATVFAPGMVQMLVELCHKSFIDIINFEQRKS